MRHTHRACLCLFSHPFSASSIDIKNLTMAQSDIVIVGGGVAGCANAVAFGKQGRSVVLLEKSLAQPERVVGELLQPGGVRALHALGMGGKPHFVSIEPDGIADTIH